MLRRQQQQQQQHLAFSSSFQLPSSFALLLNSNFRFLSHFNSATRNTQRKLPQYFTGGRAPVLPPRSPTRTVASPSPNSCSSSSASAVSSVANGGLIEKWRSDVRDEFLLFLDSQNQLVNKAPQFPHPGSTKRVSFKCKKCDSVWQARLRERNDPQQDLGCPYCVKRKPKALLLLLLSESHPEIAREWDILRSEQITSLTPHNARVDSEAVVFWNCDQCSTNFSASICNRVNKKVNCPTCVAVGSSFDPTLPKGSKSKLLSYEHCNGNNSSSNNNNKFKQNQNQQEEEEEEEDHNLPLKNNRLDQVRKNLDPVWTCTKCGSSWKGASPEQRVEQNTLCPSCSGSVLTQSNSLSRNRPDIISSLIPRLKFQPEQQQRIKLLTMFSSEKLWFACSTCNREYSMSVRERCRYKQNETACPHCLRSKRVAAIEASEKRGDYNFSISSLSSSSNQQQQIPRRMTNTNLSVKAKPGHRFPGNLRPGFVRRLSGPN